MGYVTGTCNSFEDIKSAIVSVAEAAGWTETVDEFDNTVIYKNNLYVMIDIGQNTKSTPYDDCIRITGRTGLNEGSSPLPVGMSKFYYESTSHQQYSPGPIVFPVTYHAFYYLDVDEFYFLINYNDYYQYIAFGKSNITLPGTGLWIAGTCACPGDCNYEIDSYAGRYRPMYVYMNPNGFLEQRYTSHGYISPAIFWTGKIGLTDYSSYNYSDRNYWLHHNINGNPWSLPSTTSFTDGVGVGCVERYLKSQPQQTNNQSMLIPIMAYKTCSVYPDTYYHVATLQKARHIKINYLDTEAIISDDDEQWMVFPWLKRYSTPIGEHLVHRLSSSISYGTNHSGNYGWAIKKEV